MGQQRNLEEIGLESFGLGEAPDSGQVTDTNSVIVSADVDMAYVVVTLLSVTAGNVFMAQRSAAVAGKGQLMVIGEARKIFGDKTVQMVVDTGAATAEIAFQVFKRGLPRQGTAAP